MCAALLACGLLGCRHTEPPVIAPQASTAPPAAPTPITVITPLPTLPQSAKPNVQLAPLELPQPKPAQVKHPRSLHRKAHHPPTAVAEAGEAKVAPNPASGTPAAPSPVPANGTPVNGGTATAGNVTSSTLAQEAAPELGNLSTGTAISNTEKTRMNREIEQLEGRLGKVKEPTTTDERAAVLQIRAFLERAKQSIEENDLDGAQTLNTKARVLLEELQSQ